LLIVLEEGRLTAHDTVTIIYGDTVNGKSPGALARVDRYAESDEQFIIKVDGNGDSFFTPIAESPSLDIQGREAVKLVAYAPAMVRTGERFTCNVSALDVFGNRDINFTGTVELSVKSGTVDIPERWEFQPADSGSVEIPVVAENSGIQLIESHSTDGRMAAISNPVLCSNSRPEYSLYWGDLQGHSELGDGSAQPYEYYTYARDVSRLDIASLTEHDAHGFFPLDENQHLWELIREVTEIYNEPGRFVTLLGYEWTSWTYGHRHILYPGVEGEIFSFRDPDSDTPEELWELVQPYGAIVIPHHPGGGPIATDWDHHDDKAEPLVEICSVHGNSDYYGCPLQIYSPEKGAFVQDALERGFKLGILASGDTHDGHPGRKSAGYPSMGIAGIWAGELSRKSIWEALMAKRIYGTSGARILLEFEIDGHLMGETFELKDEAEMQIKVHAIGTTKIKQVEILENARILFKDEVGKTEVNLRYTHTIKPDYYYRVRLMQTDQEMAWSSPIWSAGK
jgi:hypothetical protein